jgi:hypothetical protein
MNVGRNKLVKIRSHLLYADEPDAVRVPFREFFCSQSQRLVVKLSVQRLLNLYWNFSGRKKHRIMLKIKIRNQVQQKSPSQNFNGAHPGYPNSGEFRLK